MTAAPPGQIELYGLPDVYERGEVFELVGKHAPDVLHLHHDCAAQGLMGWVRRRFPKVRIVLTIHGEPDRSRGLGREQPDAYHVVAPDLLPLTAGRKAPARWIPNHPGWAPPDSPPLSARPRVLWCPFSHVRDFKDWGWLDRARHSLEQAGWTIDREPTIIPNETVRSRLWSAAAAWIHRQGYLDILTMEAMSLGALPIVRLSAEARLAWSQALGFSPKLVDSEEPLLLARNLAEFGQLDADENRLGMVANWTPAECGSRWAAFLSEVATVA